jgi:hypothetical protein
MQVGNRTRQPLGPQPDICAVRADIGALYEQLHNARLLGWE